MATAATVTPPQPLLEQITSMTGSQFVMVDDQQASRATDGSSTKSAATSTDSMPKQIAVLDSGATGLNDHAKETLDAMQAAPALPDDSDQIEAAVGHAKGDKPELTVETRDRSDTQDSKVSWLKKLGGARTRSPSVAKSRDATDVGTVSPGPLLASSPIEDESASIETTDALRPTADSLQDQKLPSAGSIHSIHDDVTSEYDVDPAVSERRFHRLFTAVSPDERLIETYVCALVRDIAIAGRLYISEHHVGFRTNILGFSTSVSIPFSEITTIEKRTTAKVIPNAIEIVTSNSKHLFSNLLKRDSCYNLLVAVWRHEHPEEQRVRDKRDRGESDPSDVSDDRNAEAKSEVSFEDDHGQQKKHIFRDVFNGKLLKTMTKKDTSSGRTAAEQVKDQALKRDLGHEPTFFYGEEYSHEVSDFVLPTSPVKAFNLLFKDEGFLRPFLEEMEHLRDLQLGQWQGEEGSQTREMDYIKPLNSSIGPKQTHCIVHDEEEVFDPETSIADVTTTRTPDVPSGNDFATMTKTVFTWSETGGTRVHVTSDVEWTKVNRMLKGIIERSCIEGQKKYHEDLEKAAKQYIEDHRSDFEDPGVTSCNEPPATKLSSVSLGDSSSPVPASVQAIIDAITQPSLAVIMGIIVCVLILTNIWTLVALRHQARALRTMRLGHPGEVANAVSRVLDSFHSVYESAGPRSQAFDAHRVKVELGQLAGAVDQVEKGLQQVSDRLAGLRQML
ncbi:hypothetical protein OIV83_003626 [Microbotryomycetes sp. JL201]|nr:hypothetical protein OIV83_003626 [Microbotryomycetes sp. JL201]